MEEADIIHKHQLESGEVINISSASKNDGIEEKKIEEEILVNAESQDEMDIITKENNLTEIQVKSEKELEDIDEEIENNCQIILGTDDEDEYDDEDECEDSQIDFETDEDDIDDEGEASEYEDSDEEYHSCSEVDMEQKIKNDISIVESSVDEDAISLSTAIDADSEEIMESDPGSVIEQDPIEEDEPQHVDKDRIPPSNTLFDRIGIVDDGQEDLVWSYIEDYNNVVIEESEGSGVSTYFDQFQEIINISKGELHQNCDIKLLNLFAVNRPYEDGDFKDVGRNKLLMHGRSSSDVYTVLRDGFETMWGGNHALFRAGYYFQDCSTKAANFAVLGAYDYQNKADYQECWLEDGTIFYIFFCEVSMGNCYVAERQVKTFLDVVWENHDSMRCSGICEPENSPHIYLEGLPVVTGPFQSPPSNSKTLRNNSRGRHIYNDYVVRELSQIKVKYLAECKYVAHGPIELPFALKNGFFPNLTAKAPSHC